MEERYGPEKGEKVFYASKNKGTITGVHSAADAAPKTNPPDKGGSKLDQPKWGSTEPLGVGDTGDGPLLQLERQIGDERHGQMLMPHVDRLEARVNDCVSKIDDYCARRDAEARAQQDAAEEQAAMLAGNVASAQARAERAGVKLNRFDQVSSGAMPVPPPAAARGEAAIAGGRGGNVLAR